MRLIPLILFICSVSFGQTAQPYKPVIIAAPLESNGAIPVNIQDQHTPVINHYLYLSQAELTLSGTDTVDSKTITVASATGADAGDVLTICEGHRIYQSLVSSVNGNVITLASPLDYAFTPASVIHVGLWNMAVDGTTTKTFVFKAPAAIDIYTVTVNITDNTEMDVAKFGGITALTNGVLFRLSDGAIYNRSLIYSNQGFLDQSFKLEFYTKAPAGTYGMSVTKNVREINGVSIRLETGDEYQVIIQDNLTGLSTMTCTVNGHFVTY